VKRTCLRSNERLEMECSVRGWSSSNAARVELWPCCLRYSRTSASATRSAFMPQHPCTARTVKAHQWPRRVATQSGLRCTRERSLARSTPLSVQQRCGASRVSKRAVTKGARVEPYDRVRPGTQQAPAISHVLRGARRGSSCASEGISPRWRNIARAMWLRWLLYGLLCTAVLAQNSAWLEGQAGYQTCLLNRATCATLSFFNRALTGSIPSNVGLLTALTSVYVHLLNPAR
jgi:hypothetical protein